MPPTVDFISSSTLRPASLTAASTRSCSISISPDLTTSGSMVMASNCFCPFMRTRTLPPPAEASITVACIFFCSDSYCSFACDIRR